MLDPLRAAVRGAAVAAVAERDEFSHGFSLVDILGLIHWR